MTPTFRQRIQAFRGREIAGFHRLEPALIRRLATTDLSATRLVVEEEVPVVYA
jgi:hypothetical protein